MCVMERPGLCLALPTPAHCGKKRRCSRSHTHTAVCYSGSNAQNAHVVVLMVHEYLTAQVKRGEKTVKINELDF